MVSEWMANGNMQGYIRKFPGANRLELAGLTRDDLILRSWIRSWSGSLTGSAIYIATELSMGI